MTNMNRRLVRELLGLLDAPARDDLEVEVAWAEKATQRLVELVASGERFNFDAGAGVITFADGRREQL
jgi:hypothetical protein